jgi:fucose 4-O-acetylase-like acetyltransferase
MDIYRAVAITLVVLGHWLAFVLIERDDGGLTGVHVQRVWPPAEWVTWLVQVMPVFFVVGGYGSAASWRGSPAAGPRVAGTLGWLGVRLWRLLLPTLLLLGVAAAGLGGARLVGLDDGLVTAAAVLVGLTLWFLAVYLVVVSLTPLLVPAVERQGVLVPTALLTGCVLVDLLANHLRVSVVGPLTIPLFWIGMFSCGVAWRCGALRPRWLPVALIVVGATALVLLTVVGPYPVNMVAAPGERIQNNGPPSSALLALALTQLGVMLAAHDRVARWCQRPRAAKAVQAITGSVMSLYLWHMPAAIVAALVFWQTGLVAAADPLTPTWWWQRPLWGLTCAAVLLGIVLLVRPVERHRARPRPMPTTWPRLLLVALGVGLATATLVPFARGAATIGQVTLPSAWLPTIAFLGCAGGMLAVGIATGVAGVQRRRRLEGQSALPPSLT